MKDKISIIVFVLVLGTVLTMALVGVDHFTAPIIKRNEELKIKRGVLEVCGILFTEENIEHIFSENIEMLEQDTKTFYISKNKDVAFEISGPGLWGSISGIIALLADLETIKGLFIIHQEETPGLGGRIGEKEYLSKFKDKKIFPHLTILRPGRKAEKDTEVDGITGATMTGDAFEKMINNQMRKYVKLIREK